MSSRTVFQIALSERTVPRMRARCQAERHQRAFLAGAPKTECRELSTLTSNWTKTGEFQDLGVWLTYCMFKRLPSLPPTFIFFPRTPPGVTRRNVRYKNAFITEKYTLGVYFKSYSPLSIARKRAVYTLLWTNGDSRSSTAMVSTVPLMGLIFSQPAGSL